MGGFNREPPPIGRTNALDPDVECQYVLAYRRIASRADHESWLLEWSLGWITEPGALGVRIDRRGDERYRITVATSVGCREAMPTEYRRRIRLLEDRAAGLDAQCKPPDAPPHPLGIDEEPATEVCRS